MALYVYATSAGIYATDGTDAGTVLLEATGPDLVPQTGTPMVTLANGKVLFFTFVNPNLDPGAAFTTGIRIWETDGTAAGTVLTGTVAPPDGLTFGGDSISNVVAIGDKVAFTYNFGGIPLPYVTDGTTAGTTGGAAVLPALGAVTGGPTPNYIYATSAGVYATDGSSSVLLEATGPDLVPQTGTPMVTLPNGKVLFFTFVNSSQDPGAAFTTGIRIWETDGTAAGTVLTGTVSPPDGLIFAGDSISNVVAIGDKVAFTFNFGGTPLPYVTDGTTAGTTGGAAVLPALGAVTGGPTPNYIYATSAGVYATDGSSSVLLEATGPDLVPQTGTPMVTLANGKVLFFTFVNPSLDPGAAFTTGIRIWETDGTAAGTVLTGTVAPPDGLMFAGDSISNVVAIGDKVAFTFNFGGTPLPYVTDGTTAGTTGGAAALPALGADPVTCFLAGTRIATPLGETKVEALRPGDTLRTAPGGTARVVWVGHRHIDAERHRAPGEVWPILIRAGALADCVPARDLWVSPEHAMLLDGGLVPARLLVNGGSIVQDGSRRLLAYYHVELDRHDILLAEGAPAESYLDTGNRDLFANGGQPVLLHPVFADGQECRVSRSCAPFLDDAERVEPIWRRLAARSAALGFGAAEPAATTDDPGLALLAGGRRLRPVAVQGAVHLFVVPPVRGTIRLVSRATAPCALRPWVADRRPLGVAVERITVQRDGGMAVLPADHPALADGWWAAETDGRCTWRWTNGHALLPLAGGAAMVVTVTLGGVARYLVEDGLALAA